MFCSLLDFMDDIWKLIVKAVNGEILPFESELDDLSIPDRVCDLWPSYNKSDVIQSYKDNFSNFAESVKL